MTGRFHPAISMLIAYSTRLAGPCSATAQSQRRGEPSAVTLSEGPTEICGNRSPVGFVLKADLAQAGRNY